MAVRSAASPARGGGRGRAPTTRRATRRASVPASPTSPRPPSSLEPRHTLLMPRILMPRLVNLIPRVVFALLASIVTLGLFAQEEIPEVARSLMEEAAAARDGNRVEEAIAKYARVIEVAPAL